MMNETDSKVFFELLKTKVSQVNKYQLACL